MNEVDCQPCSLLAADGLIKLNEKKKKADVQDLLHGFLPLIEWSG